MVFLVDQCKFQKDGFAEHRQLISLIQVIIGLEVVIS